MHVFVDMFPSALLLSNLKIHASYFILREILVILSMKLYEMYACVSNCCN